MENTTEQIYNLKVNHLNKMRIAVIGAGAAGLAALRHCTSQSNKKSIEVICYEQSGDIGGTWVYTPEVGRDAYGLSIHSSMYKNLRTNLPKEVMGFPDFPIPDNDKSYLTRTELLDFINTYCDHFELRKYIQFHHHVVLVKPLDGDNMGKWSVEVEDLEKKKVLVEVFDAIMICNGHYFQPNIPELEGHTSFKGRVLHSHDYRVPETFAGKKVVVFGAGPSGMDLALEISKHAHQVILSHHLKVPILTKFPSNVIQKPDVVQLREHQAVFKDGSKENVDTIFYCTGYKYSFPFLDKNCGVKVDRNMVTPLWKHLLAIESPTLAFVGLPYYVCAFSMFDLQVRFVLRFWQGFKKLPPKENMLAEESMELKKKLSEGLHVQQFHMMGSKQGLYYEDLAKTADLDPLPPVLTSLHNESSQKFIDDLLNYREDRYKIIDDHTYVQL
ncbi:senecionine N-oxygenase [Neodiprion pinetum]|uniref:senecionine N-oxygenase n=1 Tax=Neodiprion pinetum TaxID=441929 RepID=UPI001EDE7633|nr:senecionine N-oxygenase [Neodiprion pinetum]XP_046481449.1 senecionine N-oxygenase [Neodiprion pinetum]XP_046481450.1 senecionine N-oxygenase [Neodiprion pinetum]XP_046481451.1 senecionine N-oxygenase [Neodiprion pinetum]